MSISRANTASEAFSQELRYHQKMVTTYDNELSRIKSGHITNVTPAKIAMLQVKMKFHQEEVDRIREIKVIPRFFFDATKRKSA